jgi:cystathionine gamma-lyase
VKEVYYPGLKSFAYHEVAKKQMRGFGGMMSFRIKGGKEQSSKFARALKLFVLAVSLGGPDSLVEVPMLMTQRNSNVPFETRIKLGITEDLIRLSICI